MRLVYLLEHLFLAELIKPSESLWLVSPWISNIEIFDNRAGGYTAFDHSWPLKVHLIDVLVRLMTLGTEIIVCTRPNDWNRRFITALELRCRGTLRERLKIIKEEDLHSKGILSDDFWLSGSMNITRNGVEVLDETIRFETGREIIAETRLNLTELYLDD